MGRAIYPFFMMKKIKIVKPHQNAGVWYHADQIIDAEDTRAKDLIEAGLATSDLTEPEKTKERLGKQTKPNKATLTKSEKTNIGENESDQSDFGLNSENGEQGADQGSDSNPDAGSQDNKNSSEE